MAENMFFMPPRHPPPVRAPNTAADKKNTAAGKWKNVPPFFIFPPAGFLHLRHPPSSGLQGFVRHAFFPSPLQTCRHILKT